MTDPILFRGLVRATDREGYRIRGSVNWLFSRWANLTLTPSALVCRDWHLPYAEIEDAAIVTVPLWPCAAKRLIVRCRGVAYQFLLNPLWAEVSPCWNGPLPFPVRRETRELEPLRLPRLFRFRP